MFELINSIRNVGTLDYMNYHALEYDDIIRVEPSGMPLTVNIICKPYYHIDEILDYADKYLTLDLDYEVIVKSVNGVK